MIKNVKTDFAIWYLFIFDKISENLITKNLLTFNFNSTLKNFNWKKILNMTCNDAYQKPKQNYLKKHISLVKYVTKSKKLNFFLPNEIKM